MAAEFGTGVAATVAETCIDKAMKEVGYLCCFKSYVEGFEKEHSRLRATRESVRKDIEEARQRNENQIDDETEQWLKDVNSLIEVDPKAKKKWFFGLCTDCIWQYKRGKELAEKTLEIPKLMERRNNLVRVARSAGLPGMEYHYSPDFISFESRKDRFEEVKKALRDENNHIIGLQGMGGTGKTTMAKQIGKEVEESKLFDKVVFTVVSNPPDVKKVRSDIAMHLVSQLEDAKKLEERAENLWSRIANGGEKLLIILDDVWDKELDLKAIGIPLGHHGKGHCSVFLTTRDLKVCKAMGCQIIQLEVLPDKDALNLFLFHAVKCGADSSSDFEDVALNIVKGCGGLPVAIEAIAKALNSEPLEDWKAASTRLQNFDPMLYDVDGDMRKAYNCLKLSYDNLKNQQAKELFLLSSLFPEDFEIPVELLSRIAIGLGLCGEVGKYYLARSQVPKITHKLIDSSLLLKAKKECIKMDDLVLKLAPWIRNNEIQVVMMHDLVREVALWIGNNEIQVVMDSKTILKENIRYSSWNIDGIPNGFNGSKLEFLLVWINAKDHVKLSDALFKDMTRLRVFMFICTLKSRKAPTLSLPQSILSLGGIRTLILEKWELRDISILKNLKSLETLEFTGCLITELPNEVQTLEKLRLLCLKRCKIKRNNPFKVIEGSPQLEELYYVNNVDVLVTENNDEEYHHIRTLPALQRYHIICSGNYDYLEVDASISSCFKPRHLKRAFSEETFKFLAARAEILALGEYHETGWTNLVPDIVPMEDGGLKDLIELHLYDWSEIECLIHTQYLQSGVTIFSKLVTLKLDRMDVKELCCGPLPNDFLKKLEIVNLMGCLKLESTLFKGKIDLGNLKSITVSYCSMTSLFHPPTTWSLKQLKTLNIHGCRQLKYIVTNEGSGEEIVNDHDEGAGKEIIFPSLEEMVVSGVPKFINFLEYQCNHPRSSIMKNSSATTGDDLKVNNPSRNFTFSWAPTCCFQPKSSATRIDNPCVSEETLPNRTNSQALKTKPDLGIEQCLLRPPLNPHNMRELTITHCSELTSLFTLPTASSMLLLEKLEVMKCHGLKHIVTDEGDGHDHMNYSSIFPNLQHVSVKNCNLLESLFPASHCRTLDHLNYVEISGAPGLRYLFGKCYCEDNSPHQNQNIEIRLPSLEDLDIKHVPNMVGICTENCYLMALSLDFIRLRDCPQLHRGPFFDLTDGWHEGREELTRRKAMEMQPENLRDVHLSNLKIDGIYDLEGPQIKGPVKSRLEGMRLRDLPELRYICVGLNNILSLQNLSCLIIFGCEKLKVIFSASILRRLPQLGEIIVSDCEELVQIIEETEQNPDLLHQVCFPKLYKIIVNECKRLKCLFSISTCGVLPNLNELKIVDAPKLVQVFENKNGETKELVMKDVFPNLENLELKNLPNLDSVCQGFDFQIVPERFVHGCPNVSLTSTISTRDDHDIDSALYLYDSFSTASSETSSSDEESSEDQDDEVQATSSEKAASQSTKLAGSDFQLVPTRIVHNCPKISPSSSTTMKDEDEDSQESDQEMVEYNENPAQETNSQLQEGELPPSQFNTNQYMPHNISQSELSESTKEATKEVVEKDLGMQEQNNSTPNLKGVIKETMNSRGQEEPKLEKTTVANEIMESELSNAAPTPFVTLQNGSPKDTLVGKEAEDETTVMEEQAPAETRLDMHSDDSQNNTEVRIGEGLSSEKYSKKTSLTHSKPEILHPDSLTITKELNEKKLMGNGEALGESISTNEAARGVDKPLDNTREVEEPTSECSSEERSNITALAIPLPFVETRDSAFNPVATSSADNSPLDQTIVNQTEIDIDEEMIDTYTKPEQFEEDDLIRLFRIMEVGADMEIHMPYVPKIAAVEDDNKMAKAFADLEVLLKMDLNEIVSSEECSFRLENALNFLSILCAEEEPLSHGLSATIDSLHLEIQSILSSFKQASFTVHIFTELEGKEKFMSQELPQRKKVAKTLVSEIDKTKKSMAEAQQKEAELNEQISRLQAELNNKEKEIKECEFKLSCLEEQKKKSVWDNMGFMKELGDVKKDKSQMAEDQKKARKELEKSKVKWSSCVANLRTTTMLLGIYLKQKI